jgi:dihydrofolate reductase
MRKLIVSEFLTLDGVMQSPGSREEDPSGGFDRGGWQQPYYDEVGGQYVREGLQSAGGLLLGRVTYEIFAGYWPSAPADNSLAEIMNAMTKYVASTTLQEPLGWQNSTLVTGDVPEAVRRLTQEAGKDLLVIGSGQLVQTLIAHDLVDEYRLMIHPLALGKGKRLFRDEIPRTPLRLIESTQTTTGVLLAVYAPADRG